MTSSAVGEQELFARVALQRLDPVPDFEGGLLLPRHPTLTRRDTSSSSTVVPAVDGTQSCSAHDTTGACTRYLDSQSLTKTAPIVLGVLIPVVSALVLLVILHRRNVKRLRREDAEDRQKSLDFGMGPTAIMEKKKRSNRTSKHPEMASKEVHGLGRGDRGMSLDITTLAGPYILPPELQGSRESLHSLSKTFPGGEDRYRPTDFIPDDGSIRSPSSLNRHDTASIYTYSSRHRTETESTKGLIMSAPTPTHDPVPIIKKPSPIAKDNTASLLAPAANDTARESYVSTASNNENITAMRASNNYLGQYISGGAKKQAGENDGPKVTVAELDDTSSHSHDGVPTSGLNVNDDSSKGTSKESSQHNSIIPTDAGFDFNIPPNTYELSSGHDATLPQFDITPADNSTNETYEMPGDQSRISDLSSPRADADMKLQYGGVRPRESSLQPNATNHNGTLRSNVNSQYTDVSDYYDENDEDEYNLSSYQDVLGYDPRRLTMGMRPLPPDDPTENPEERALRIRSFYKEYFEETSKPGGEKARLSYYDGSENYIDDYYGSNNQASYGHNSYGYGSRVPSTMSARGPPGRHHPNMSHSSYLRGGPGPRAHSSASQRIGGPGMRMMPKKKLPPQRPLHALRNPATFKDDTMILNSIDFAPPQALNRERAGTLDSPRGSRVPRAFNPLVSSFDDLSVLPSPHSLRKSGTFSSLDFAPPRFGAVATASDAGSIRSNQSGMSSKQLHSLRAGAYRLSRIPKELAGTKEELADALKPKWNLDR